MGWFVAIAVIAAIGLIPVGVYISYDSQGFIAKIVAGFIRYTVFPFPKKKKPQNTSVPQSKPEKTKSSGTAPQKSSAPQTGNTSKGGSLMDFWPFAELGFRFLNSFRKKLRLNHVMIHLNLGGDDPCDLAVNYGRAWAAAGHLLSSLEHVFVIKKRDIDVGCDFTSAETTICLNMDITITIGRMCALGAYYGFCAIKEFLRFKKKRKGGAAL